MNKFFVHGIRHVPLPAQARISTLRPGESLVLEPENNNTDDSQAVAVLTEGDRVRIGYVPRYLAREVRALLAECDASFVQLQVERVNGRAPLQQRLLCRMKACWPDGFSPCRGDEFQPIVSGLPSAIS